MSERKKIDELRPFAVKLLNRFATRILEDAPENASILAGLATDMTYFAVREDQRGMDAVVGRVAGITLKTKLKAESAATEVLGMIGDALMDAASHFVPRLIANLTKDSTT